MRIEKISVRRVEFIPDELQDGVIYISEKFGVSRHNCFCGCGAGVVLPLNRWSHFEDMMDGTLNITPSIGSLNLPCQSHYYIKNNRVDWL